MKNIIRLLKNSKFRRGFIFAAGAIAVVDVILVHWALNLHHVVSGQYAFESDLIIFIIGMLLIVYAVLKR